MDYVLVGGVVMVTFHVAMVIRALNDKRKEIRDAAIERRSTGNDFATQGQGGDQCLSGETVRREYLHN